MTNFPSLHLPKKVFISSLFLKDIFDGYISLEFSHPLNTLNISLHFLLACLVSDTKSNIIFDPLRGSLLHSVRSFQDFSLSLIFYSLHMICLRADFWYLSCLVFSSFPGCVVWSVINYGKFRYYFFKYLFCSFLSSFSF